MEMKPIQIIYAPGTFGNCLRWLFDRFSAGSKFKDIDSPWDKDGRAHGFKGHDFLQRFERGHQVADQHSAPNEKANKIILSFQSKDLPFIERCGYYRNPGKESEASRYKEIIESADKKFIETTYGNKINKSVAKEIMKIQFHDMQNQTWWKSMENFINDKQHHQFDMYSLWDKDMLTKEMQNVSEKFHLDLTIEQNVIDNVVQKIKATDVVKTKDRATQVLDAVINKIDMPCQDCDIIEQAFIETELEKMYDSVLFPYGVNWFTNTNQIIDFLDTYPTYLKHMNPRLPWYNNIKNPFYLKGRFDKSK
jgi:hypothetical protein